MFFLRKLIIILLVLLITSCGSSGGTSDVVDGDDDDNISSPVEGRENIPPYLGAGMFAVDNSKFDTETALDLLRTSASPVLSYIPGVFGHDKSNFPYMMDSLLSEGINVHVQLYVLCGPCRPPRRDGSLVQFRSDLNIDELNSAIQWDPEVRSQYLDYVIDVIAPLVDSYPQLRFTIVPELEDNHTNESFSALLDLTHTALAGRSNIDFQRNALHFNGTRIFGQHRVSLEMHTTHLGNLALLSSGDTVSLDGQLFSFKGEDVSCKVDADFEDIQTLIKGSLERGINFQLWRHEWQGLPQCGGSAPSIENRVYQFTYIDQIKELLKIE